MNGIAALVSLRSCLGFLAGLMGGLWFVLWIGGVVLAYDYIDDKRDKARQEKGGAA